MLDAPQTAPDTGFRIAAAELVPPELLDIPDRRDRRFIERDLAAEVIDDYLRRLASQESRSRRLLGRLCRTLLRRRAYHRLGFARLSDYTRERLGISASEVRGFAAVSDRLEHLPAVAEAFEKGEISWSKVRLLVAVCTHATEEGWVELARIRTVRALKQAIEAAARDGDVVRRPGVWPDLRETLDEVDGRMAASRPCVFAFVVREGSFPSGGEPWSSPGGCSGRTIRWPRLRMRSPRRGLRLSSLRMKEST